MNKLTHTNHHTSLQFIATMSASADVLALANAEFEIGDIPAGQGITVKWRGKPIFIRHRTKAEIDKEAAVSMAELRDEETDASRAQRPEWCVSLWACGFGVTFYDCIY